MKQKQLDDSDLAGIITWLEKGTRPFGSLVQAAGPTVRHYLLLWDSLNLEDGVLHRWFYRQDSSSYLQGMVPKSLTPKVLHQMHDT